MLRSNRNAKRFTAIVLGTAYALAAAAIWQASAGTTQGPPAFGPAEKGVALSAKLARAVVHVGDPIAITFTIKDDGPPVGIFRFPSLDEYQLHGTGPDGSAMKNNVGLSTVASGRSGNGVGGGTVYQWTSSRLRLKSDFTKPGRYSFYFTSDLHLQWQLAKPPYVVLKSNTVVLTVE